MSPALFAMAAVLAPAALYAHYRLAFHIAGTGKIWLVHAVLAIAGAGLGYVTATGYAGANALLAFLAGFGAVHLPAAVILSIKWMRGAGKS